MLNSTMFHCILFVMITVSTTAHTAAELPRDITKQIIPKNSSLSEYRELKNSSGTEARQQFYVNHLIIALNFWDTDLMDDIVAFEIGRFRKKPELIFDLEKNNAEKLLLSAQYIKRTQPTQLNKFLASFTQRMKQFKIAHYYEFLPAYGVNQKHNPYLHNYLPCLFVPMYKSVQHPQQPPKQKSAIYIDINDTGSMPSDVLINNSYRFLIEDSVSGLKPVKKSNDLSHDLGEYYRLPYDFYDFDEHCNTYWDWNNAEIVIVDKHNKASVFPTLPRKITTIEDRLYLESIIGFSKKREKTRAWFYSPRSQLKKALTKTEFMPEHKNKISFILDANIPQSNVEFLIHKLIKPALVPLCCLHVPSLSPAVPLAITTKMLISLFVGAVYELCIIFCTPP